MKRSLYKIISLVLAVSLACNLMVIQAFAISTDDVQQSLDAVRTDFPNGSYFTTDGKRGSVSEFTKVAAARNVYCSGYAKAWTCVAYAKYVWAKIFGLEATNSKNRNEVGAGRAGIPATWDNAKAGDLIYFYSDAGLSKWKHAAIYLGRSGNTISLVDCNYASRDANGEHNKILYYSVTCGKSGWPYSYFRVYRATNYKSDSPTTSNVTCTITLDANGGSVSPTTQMVVKGSLIGELPTPDREGYKFLGWCTEKNSSGMIVIPGTTFVEQDETLYASWKSDCTNHTYDADICTICGAKLPYDNGFNSADAGTYQVSANTAYVRAGPYQVKDLIKTLSKGETVQVIGSVTNSYGNTWLKTSDRYYVHAEKMKETKEIEHEEIKENNVYYNITLDDGSTCRQITVVNGETYGTLPIPTKDGYSFDGWFTSQTGGSKIDSSTIVKANGAQTLFAHWTQISDQDPPQEQDYPQEQEPPQQQELPQRVEYRYGRYIDSTGKHDCWCAKYLEGLPYISGSATLQYSDWTTTRYNTSGKGWSCGNCDGNHVGVDHTGSDGRSWWAEYKLPDGSYYWEESRIVPAY